MRWFWVDRLTEFTSGQSATSIKNVAMAEERLHDHFPGIPTMPNSLILEGMAQTSGLLVSEYNGFRERVILAKVSKITFYDRARPGDTLTYRATLAATDLDGAQVATTSHIGETLQAEAHILFAHIDRDTAHRPLFEPQDFLRMLHTLRIFEVGRKADGSRLEIPEHLKSAQGEVAGH